MESAGPVLDAIFKHVDDAPATRVADNPQRVITWLKYHVREPLDTYCAYEASVQDIKALARAAGFTGKTSQSPLADIHVLQVTSASLCLEAGRGGPVA